MMRNDQIKVILIACCAAVGVVAAASLVSLVEALGIEMDRQWTMAAISIGLLAGIVPVAIVPLGDKHKPDMKGEAMTNYFINTTSEEVHEISCRYKSSPENIDLLGLHPDCHSAVALAKVKYPGANGCSHCSPDCDTG